MRQRFTDFIQRGQRRIKEHAYWKLSLPLFALLWLVLTAFGIAYSIQEDRAMLIKICLGAGMLAIFVVFVYFEERKAE